MKRPKHDQRGVALIGADSQPDKRSEQTVA
jgi:hypothetical protein